MSNKVKVALISGVVAIITAICGVFGGMQIATVMTNNQINNVIGDNNNVTINSVEDFIKDYQKIETEKQSLIEQNARYFDELETLRNNSVESEEKSNGEIAGLSDEIARLNDEIARLNDEINAFPNIQFSDLALSIDGIGIPINTKESSVSINNKTYYAYDFITSILGSGISVSFEDNIMYVGKIIKEQASLSDQWIVNKSSVGIDQNVKDSYGNAHTNSLYFYNSGSSIIYNLNEEYSFIKFNLSIYENAPLDRYGILTIKADEEIVYTSPELTKTTKQFDVIDVPINSCTLLKIEYSSNSNSNDCIVSDIVVYN